MCFSLEVHVEKGRARACIFFPVVFPTFFPVENVEVFHTSFSTYSRSKRQSKKRSRGKARQSDARSSVGPEDCQRDGVKPFSRFISFSVFFSISSKSRVVNLRELFV